MTMGTSYGTINQAATETRCALLLVVAVASYTFYFSITLIDITWHHFLFFDVLAAAWWAVSKRISRIRIPQTNVWYHNGIILRYYSTVSYDAAVSAVNVWRRRGAAHSILHLCASEVIPSENPPYNITRDRTVVVLHPKRALKSETKNQASPFISSQETKIYCRERDYRQGLFVVNICHHRKTVRGLAMGRVAAAPISK